MGRTLTIGRRTYERDPELYIARNSSWFIVVCLHCNCQRAALIQRDIIPFVHLFNVAT